MLRRALLIGSVSAGLLLGPTTGAHAAGVTGPDNFVGVESTAGDTVNTYGQAQVAVFSGDDLESENEAFSYSHDCVGCRSVTIAFQVLLVTGSPSTFAPKNYAVAANVRCTSCDSEAFARQLVVQTRTAPHLDEDAQGAVDWLSGRLQALAAADLTAPQRAEKVDALWAQVQWVVCRHVEHHDPAPVACQSTPPSTPTGT
jgi:hypothetical protein